MSTAVQLGPGEHGRPMTLEEFLAGDYQEGYRYELIHGRLYVSPEANFEHDWNERYVFRRLDRYRDRRPDILNYVTPKARVFVPGAVGVTAPEPDIAAYRNVPLHRRSRVNWREISPFLVAEFMGEEDPDKDLVRNVDLYLRVPSIQEYWLFDIRQDPDRPTLIVHRRRGDEWEITEYGPDDVYVTDLLPEFELPVSPVVE